MKGPAIRSAGRIALLYAVFAGLWIILSDRALMLITTNPDTMTHLATYKGWLFVAVTSILLYTALRRDVLLRRADLDQLQKTQEDLRRSQTLLSAIFEKSPVGVWISRGGSTLYCNPACVRLFGYDDAAEIVGRPFADLLAPSARAVVAERNLRRERGEPEPNSYETMGLRKDGTEFPYLVQIAYTELPDGWATVGFLSDLTEQVRAGEALQRVESALQETESSFRMLFAANPHPMWVTDLESLAFLEVNAAAVARYGYARDEFLSLRAADIQPEEAPPRFLDVLKAPGPPLLPARQTRHRLKDGRFIDVEVTGHRLEFGGRPAVLAVAQDITDRRQAEEKVQQQLTMLRALYSGADRLSRSLNTAEITAGVARTCVEQLGVRLAWLGRAEPDGRVAPVARCPGDSEYPGRITVRWDDTPEGSGPTGQAIRTRTPVVARDLRTNTRYGPWRHDAADHGFVTSAAFPILSHEDCFGALNLYSDEPGFFTPERTELFQTFAYQVGAALENARLYAEVRNHAAELEGRVARRTAQFESANRDLQDFSYSVSHDLRAPLRAISGFSEIVTRRHAAGLDEEGRRYVGNIVAASARMTHLVDDLLDYARLGARAVRRHPVALQGVLTEVLDDLRDRVSETGAVLSIPEELPIVSGDATLLRQVLLNLLDNALTYRRPDEAPVVTLDCREEAGRVLLRVADHGIGIPEEHQAIIFKMFQRLHSEDEYPGTGIGLAIVKKAMDLMGGQVGVESTPGGGSTFWIRLAGATGPT
jgi:PAS domain S-box-containing protein